MPGFNKVMLIGNLTRDPQVKQLPSNLTVAEFGLASSRRYRTASGEDKEEVCFVDCSAFGKQAETIVQWCKKGKPLFVDGRLKYDTWEDKAGGGKRSKLSVVVENFQFLGSRDDAPPDMFSGHTGGSHNGHNGANGTGRGAAHPGTTTATMFDDKKADRGDRPDRRPARGRAAKQTAEQPFGEEKMFEEADIPF